MTNSKLIKLRMLLLSIVFFGSINYGLTVFNYNIIDMTSDFIDKQANRKLYINHTIYFIIMLAGLILMYDLTTWLPFLGETVLPSSLIPLKTNNVDPNNKKIITIKIKPNTRVAYWASLPNTEKTPKVEQAYADYSNSGVVMSDSEGNAKLVLTIGSGYIVPRNKVIKRHVHYRELDQQYGMIGKVNTLYY
jgi:hypothetical protein